jgi:hypothetical protein
MDISSTGRVDNFGDKLQYILKYTVKDNIKDIKKTV